MAASSGGASPTRPTKLVPRLLLAVVRPFRLFFRLQAAGGITLVFTTLVALLWANSRFAGSYERLLEIPVGLSFDQQGVTWPLHHWINDALMSGFFLLVGMEIKRELTVGELRTFRRALLPAVAALGGMLVPAAIHYALNRGTAAQRGWGVPMATDIAFALGCVALVARRVPSSIVVFLMALAIFDDLGAIVVIALFYGSSLNGAALLVAGVITALLVALLRLGVTRIWPYFVLGVPLWLSVYASGIHATVAGVILGLCIPARAKRTPSEVLAELEHAVLKLRRTRESELDSAGPLAALERHLESVQPPLDRIVHGLHPWVAFLIVPLFAIANAGVHLNASIGDVALSRPSLGVLLGLLIGKPVGVFGATWLAMRFGLAPPPTGANSWQLFGVSVLAGIGFTMSIFVATLAFGGDPVLQDASKVGIFAGSALSAVIGLGVLARAGKPRSAEVVDEAADFQIDLGLPQFADGFAVEPWVASGPLVGKTLGEASLRSKRGISVLGVHRRPTDSMPEPGLLPVGPEYTISEGDTLLLVGTKGSLKDFLAGA